jgi:hypothetical protein
VTFSITQEGWYAGHPSEEGLAWAKAERERRDRLHGAGRYIANYTSRWVGCLAERGLARWLRENGVSYEWNGGFDERPDFVIDVQAVGVKCQIVKVPFRGHYPVVVPEQQRAREQEPVLFFAAYEQPMNRLVLLGAVAADAFFEQAKFVDVGEPIGPRNVATNPVWQYAARDLTHADEWLRSL